MKNVRNSIAYMNVDIDFIHITEDILKQEITKDDILLNKYTEEFNTLTEISINIETNQAYKIYYYWEDYSVNSFGLFFQQDSNVLFIGAGKASYSFDIKNKKIVNKTENDCMFWSFKPCKKFVIEFGELDCFLYDQNGKLVSECPVDPPYDIYYEEAGIKIISIVYGEQWLKFPK